MGGQVLGPCGVFRGVGGDLCVIFSCSVWLYLVVSLTNDLWMFFSDIYVFISTRVMCSSPDYLQNWLSGAWYDLSSSSVGVAWRSPPISVVTMGNSDMISVCIHVRIFVKIVSFALVWSCGI